MKQIEWKNYRHTDFLKSLDLNRNDLKFLRLFVNQKVSDFVNPDEHLENQTYYQEKVEING